jgi:DNA-binding MarR family transcriptional regulator
MLAPFFRLKRAHHSVLRLGRTPLARLGLTAARFDLLFALKISERSKVPQRSLLRILGVGRSTVSRMLGSLEELGLIERTVNEYDRRRKNVRLTTRGRWTIAFAYRQLVKSGWADLALRSALGAGGERFDWSDEEEARQAIAHLESELRDISSAFGDVAKLEYDPAPDDYDPDHPAAWYDRWLDHHAA